MNYYYYYCCCYFKYIRYYFAENWQNSWLIARMWGFHFADIFIALFYLCKFVILSKIGKIHDFSWLIVKTNSPHKWYFLNARSPLIITRFDENWQNWRLIVEIWTFFQAVIFKSAIFSQNYAIILLKKIGKIRD